MERKAWTDERLDDMAERHESQFELLLRELQETRVELRTEIREMRRDLQTDIRELRVETQAETRAVRRDMFHGAIALFAALVAMYATTLVHTLS